MNYLTEFETNLAYHFSEVLEYPFAKPQWIYISLTHKCNFNCQMCGVKKILREYELEFNILKKLLDEVASWNSDCVVVFTGGEPFLRKDIFDIIEYSVSLGLKTEVVSNGSQIDNAHIAKRIIESGLQNIAISLDGVNPQTHDYIRGFDGAYKKALDAIGYLCHEKRMRNHGPQVSVWTTIMKENIEELYEIIFLVKELGVECLVYHPVIVIQEDMQNTIKEGHFWVADDQIGILKRQINRIVGYQKKNGFVAFLHNPYLWIKYFQETLTKRDWKCNPFIFIDIGPDGFVRSCGPAFGNVKEISLTACLNTKEAKIARERMRKCQKPCLQTCWARPEADSLMNIIKNFISQLENFDGNNEHKKEIIKNKLELLTKYENLVIRNYKDGR
jgi:MoaA/NifB/PqqE/SkfB family radical SAM enzyme